MITLKRPRLALAALAAVLIVIPLALLAIPAHANVAIAWCSGNGAGRCANRYQGGDSGATPVIAYTHDLDAGEDFSENNLYTMCGGGVVTSTCPFSYIPADSRYLGDRIVDVIVDNGPLLCLGDQDGLIDANSASLTSCPSTSGAGGGTGTIDIVSSTNYIVNRMATDDLDRLSWVTDEGLSVSLNLEGPSATSAAQWKDATS